MALNKSISGSVRIPRVYCDLISYAKAIGHVKHIVSFNTTGDPLSAWDFNPAKITTYSGKDGMNYMAWGIRFNNYPFFDNPIDRQFGNLLSTINYFGALGHNFGLAAGGNIDYARIGLQGGQGTLEEGDFYADSIYSNGYEAIVGNFKPNNDLGYSLYKLTGGENGEFAQSDKIDTLVVYVYKDGGEDFSDEDTLDIGTWTCGRYFDFPHSANLSMNIKYDADGIRSKRTVGGSDLTDIAYTKPKWGNLPAWTNINLDDYVDNNSAPEFENYSNVTYRGRRTWDLTFSFLSATDTFTTDMFSNMSGDYSSSNGGTFDQNDSILGSFLTFTLNGQIPFLFSPDSTKQDIVMAKLKSNSLSIQQTAPSLYTAKMSFVEVW